MRRPRQWWLGFGALGLALGYFAIALIDQRASAAYLLATERARVAQNAAMEASSKSLAANTAAMEAISACMEYSSKVGPHPSPAQVAEAARLLAESTRLTNESTRLVAAANRLNAADTRASALMLASSTYRRRGPLDAVPFVLMLVAGGIGLRLDLRRRRGFTRRASGLCIACGYDLRSSSDRCPECGTTMVSSGASSPSL